MKRKITLALVLIVALMATAFSACSGNEESTTVYPVLSVSEAKPGDTVVVQVCIDNAERFCSMDYYLSYDASAVTLVSCYTESVTDLTSECSSGADDAGNAYLKYTGFTMRTLDLHNCALMTAEFTVNADAAAGEAFFGVAMSDYSKGKDADGNEIEEIVDAIVEGGEKLKITVS